MPPPHGLMMAWIFYFERTIGQMIMGISGGALIPLLYAFLKEPTIGFSNLLAFLLCMLRAYLFIFYYTVSGHKAGMKND